MKRTALAALLCAQALYVSPLFAADEWGEDEWADEETGSSWHGFIEAHSGARLQNDTALQDDDLTAAEVRARVETETYINDTRLSFKGDIYADGVDGGLQLNLREALAEFSLSEGVDLKAGHQVLTWGTGDLLFLNDMFAKDWVSFFSGRDDEYLKAPSTSLRLSAYGETANVELVWTPVFTSDEFIEGERFSYFSPLAGQQLAAPAGKINPDSPSETLDRSEWAARVFGNVQLAGNTTEWALYGYHGYWKQPNALSTSGNAYFSPLNVFGASIRGSLGVGLANAEVAYYDGADDQGNDPRVMNNQVRLLLGYEQEIRPRLTMGVQYYLEHLQDYSQLSANDGGSIYRSSQNRHLWTLRLNYRMLQDNLTLSWFSFWSPTDQDSYHRPSIKYRFNDQLNLTVGANLFDGEYKHTFFGQFEDASNAYARLRWSY